MKRQLIAGMTMVALLTSISPVWAQGEQTKPSWVLCGVEPTEVPYTLAAWHQMDEPTRRAVCTVEGKSPVVADPPPPPARRNFSDKTGITGAVLILAGVIMVTPKGHEYHILGDTYCVDTYRVDYGGCGPGITLAKIGLLTISAGVGLAWLGFHDVDVKPIVAPGTKGAVATVKWGGKGK